MTSHDSGLPDNVFAEQNRTGSSCQRCLCVPLGIGRRTQISVLHKVLGSEDHARMKGLAGHVKRSSGCDPHFPSASRCGAFIFARSKVPKQLHPADRAQKPHQERPRFIHKLAVCQAFRPPPTWYVTCPLSHFVHLGPLATMDCWNVCMFDPGVQHSACP